MARDVRRARADLARGDADDDPTARPRLRTLGYRAGPGDRPRAGGRTRAAGGSRPVRVGRGARVLRDLPATDADPNGAASPGRRDRVRLLPDPLPDVPRVLPRREVEPRPGCARRLLLVPRGGRDLVPRGVRQAR